jgi:hypothetical protein
MNYFFAILNEKYRRCGLNLRFETSGSAMAYGFIYRLHTTHKT